MLVFGLVHTSSPLITHQVSLKHHWLMGEPHLTHPRLHQVPQVWALRATRFTLPTVILHHVTL